MPSTSLTMDEIRELAKTSKSTVRLDMNHQFRYNRSAQRWFVINNSPNARGYPPRPMPTNWIVTQGQVGQW